jgi:hypothetical protein
VFRAGCRFRSFRLSSASRFFVPVVPRTVHAIVPLSFRCWCFTALLSGTPGYRGLCHRVVCFGSRVKNKTPRYRSGAVKFWIITESTREVTTVLLPEDFRNFSRVLTGFSNFLFQ